MVCLTSFRSARQLLSRFRGLTNVRQSGIFISPTSPTPSSFFSTYLPTMSSPPPAPTRHITTTSADTGLSSIWISEAIPIKPTYEGAPTGRGRIWIQEGIPGNNDPAGEIDGGKLKQNAVVREGAFSCFRVWVG